MLRKGLRKLFVRTGKLSAVTLALLLGSMFWTSSSYSFAQEQKVIWANPDCMNPKSHDEADLCVQQRMARSSDESSRLSELQTWIGAIGTIVLIVTIILTYRATRAAEVSAEKAHEAIRQNSIFSAAQLRAYVFVDQADLEKNVITLAIKNFGQTPAYRVRHSTSHSVVLIGNGGFKLEQSDISFELGPGQSHFKTILFDEDSLIFSQGVQLFEIGKFYLYGEIRYFDSFSDEERITEYRLEYGGGYGPLKRSNEGNRAT